MRHLGSKTANPNHPLIGANMQNVRQIQSQNVRVHGELLVITNETINATCDHFMYNKLRCIEEVQYKGVFVNDPELYFMECLASFENYKAGTFDIWLGFWQHAVFIQTNKSVPIL